MWKLKADGPIERVQNDTSAAHELQDTEIILKTPQLLGDAAEK
jgi:hypothetical protein